MEYIRRWYLFHPTNGITDAEDSREDFAPDSFRLCLEVFVVREIPPTQRSFPISTVAALLGKHISCSCRSTCSTKRTTERLSTHRRSLLRQSHVVDRQRSHVETKWDSFDHSNLFQYALQIHCRHNVLTHKPMYTSLFRHVDDSSRFRFRVGIHRRIPVSLQPRTRKWCCPTIFGHVPSSSFDYELLLMSRFFVGHCQIAGRHEPGDIVRLHLSEKYFKKPIK